MLDDSQIRDVLQTAKTIAVVGHSDNPGRTSYQIARFLRNAGYTVYAVNPTVSEIDGEISYASVQDIPDEIDIVDVFRRSEFLDGVVEDAIAAGAKTVWSQLGVSDESAADKATEAGLNMVMNRCIKVEHMRLL
ncbi:MAG: CoA-binding protein [Aggregatilineales bacterium]